MTRRAFVMGRAAHGYLLARCHEADATKTPPYGISCVADNTRGEKVSTGEESKHWFTLNQKDSPYSKSQRRVVSDGSTKQHISSSWLQRASTISQHFNFQLMHTTLKKT